MRKSHHRNRYPTLFAWRACAWGALAVLAAGCAPLDGGPASAARTSNETLVQITDMGAGSLAADTRYDAREIAARLPGFTTDFVSTAIEDDVVPVIAVFSDDGFQVLLVLKGTGGRIGAVHGVTHHLTGPNGERIGMTFAEAGMREDNCRVGRRLWRGMAICPARGAANVELVFAVPEYAGPFDRLPSGDELRGATLQRIVWQPS